MALPRPYLVSIDMNKNELMNSVIHKLATAPAGPVSGQVYYNTTDNLLYGYNGTAWVDLMATGGGYTHPTFSASDLDFATNGATVVSNLDVNAEGHVTAVATRLMTLADLGFTGDANANNYVHPSDGVDLGAALTGANVISDVNVNAAGHVTGFATRALTAADIGAAVINDAATSTGETWSSTKISTEIANAITNGMDFKGGYDATANTPDLDSAPSGVKIGDTYVVSTAGTFFTEDVQVGDMLIAKIDDAATLADWVLVNKNIPDIVSASTIVEGLVFLATQAEVDAGTNAVKVVTPATLKGHLDAYGMMLRYSETIGDGATTDFTITHSLGSKDVLIAVYNVATDTKVETDESTPTVNTASIKFNTAPTANQFRVVVIG